MTRLYLVAGILAALAMVLASVWYMGGQAAQDRAERDAMQRTIENVDKFNKAAGNADGVPWYDRLFPDAAD